MGPSDNRRTQIDMLSIAGAKLPNKIVDRAAMFDSLGSASQKDVLRERAGSRESTRTSNASAGADISRPRTTRPVTSGSLQLRAVWESPWEKYEKIYGLELSGPAEVAVRKAPPVRLVLVRAFASQAAAQTLHVYRQLQHQNLVTALEAFTTDGGLYMILEHLPLSLSQIVRSPAYPEERQLAAILGQVVAGMAYLAAEGFEHGSLTSSNILLNTDGDVKIANQECCHKIDSKNMSRDIRSLSAITMELMQKYVKEDGAIGVDNLHRWPSNSDALGFLSATTSAASAAELLKHPLLSRPYQKESLIGIISLAQVCMRGCYKYTQRDISD